MSRSARHELKCWPGFFDMIVHGLKTWELRVNDRDYRVGDILWLREWDPDVIGVVDVADLSPVMPYPPRNCGVYTGAECEVLVRAVTPCFGDIAIENPKRGRSIEIKYRRDKPIVIMSIHLLLDSEEKIRLKERIRLADEARMEAYRIWQADQTDENLRTLSLATQEAHEARRVWGMAGFKAAHNQHILDL